MKFTHNCKGITLIEVIVSIAVMGIVAIIILSIFTAGYVGIVKSGQRAEAAYLAQQEMTNMLIQRNSFIDNTLILYNFNSSGIIPVNIDIMESEIIINGIISTMISFVPHPDN